MKTLVRAASLQHLSLEVLVALQQQVEETHEKCFNMKENTTGFNIDSMS